jgi:hypothetical protein
MLAPKAVQAWHPKKRDGRQCHPAVVPQPNICKTVSQQEVKWPQSNPRQPLTTEVAIAVIQRQNTGICLDIYTQKETSKHTHAADLE